MEERAQVADPEPEEPDRVPPDEMAEILRSLPVDEIGRAERYARAICRPGGRDPKEVMGEAFSAIMQGERTCRKGTDPVAFLCGSMRSILSNEARKQVRHVALPDESDGRKMPTGAYVDPRDTEDDDEAARRERLSAMKDRLETDLLAGDDDECLRLYQAMESGLRGEGLAEAIGRNKHELATIRRRFKRLCRRVAGAFPLAAD